MALFLGLVGHATAHTNSVGMVKTVDSAANTIDLTIVYGSYHGGAQPEGALALYVRLFSTATCACCAPPPCRTPCCP